MVAACLLVFSLFFAVFPNQIPKKVNREWLPHFSAPRRDEKTWWPGTELNRRRQPFQT
jgi:hypothetical protein